MTPPDGHRSSLSRSVAIVWRTLRSMRTAIILLLMLAAAAVVGSLIPQIPNSPERVAAYQLDHPFWGTFFSAAGFFDVFGSWWFGLITAPAVRVADRVPAPALAAPCWRAARARPIQARELDAFPSYRRAAAWRPRRRTRRRRRAKVLRRQAATASSSPTGRRGGRREGRSCGRSAAWPSTGRSSLLLVARHRREGDRLRGPRHDRGGGDVDRRAAELRRRPADGPVLRGGFSRDPDHASSDFEDDYRDTGSRWTSTRRCSSRTPTAARRAAVDVRINHPSVFNGIRIFQYGFGWAAMMRVSRGTRVLFDGPVVMGQDTPPGENPLAQPWVRLRQAADAAPATGDRARAVSGRRGLLPDVADGRAATDDAGQRAVHALPGVAGEAAGHLAVRAGHAFHARVRLGRDRRGDGPSTCDARLRRLGRPSGRCPPRPATSSARRPPGPTALLDVVPGAPAVLAVADLARRDGSLRARRRLSSSCSGSAAGAVRVPAQGLGPGRGPTGRGRSSRWEGSRCSGRIAFDEEFASLVEAVRDGRRRRVRPRSPRRCCDRDRPPSGRGCRPTRSTSRCSPTSRRWSRRSPTSPSARERLHTPGDRDRDRRASSPTACRS